MAKKLDVKIIKVPLYPCRFGVIVSNGYKGVNKFLKSQGMSENIDFVDYDAVTITHGVTIGKNGRRLRCVYIVLNTRDRGFTHGVVAHEIRHATNAILQHIEQRLDPNNDEAEAYLAGWIADFVYSVIDMGNNIKNLKIV